MNGNDQETIVKDETISLNVGGKLVFVSRTTLTKVKGSLLERMFDPSSPLPPSRLVDGAFFLDEDPDVFRAILTWLRHGVLETRNLTEDHLRAAASYYGLDMLSELLQSRVRDEEERRRLADEHRASLLESLRLLRESIEETRRQLKGAIDAVFHNIRDLPNFIVPELLEFQVAMALSSLKGGTLTQICRQICLEQLTSESHVAPADICHIVMFALKKMRQSKGPLRVEEDARGIWELVALKDKRSWP